MATLIGLIIGIVVYCMICGGYGQHIAIEKSRDPNEGAAFGIVFGPFGLLLLVLMPDGPALASRALAKQIVADALKPVARKTLDEREQAKRPKRYTDAEWSRINSAGN
jgi:hypothetical protein